MSVERVSTVLPASDLSAAVATWSALLGVPPTFVDGDRWAQFDVGSVRLALAGSDRVTALPGVMLKVADLAAAREQAIEAGCTTTEPQVGAHEIRCLVDGPDGWPVTLYEQR